jgi:L-iditol 2-dehydrogenase
MCPHYRFIGSSRHGGLAQYAAVPAINCVRLDDSVSFAQAAMIEPSTVALHGLRVGGYRGGGRVAILGGGTVGLYAAQWARILGAKTVTVIDVAAHRLEVARLFGADNVLDSRTPGLTDAVSELTSGDGFDHVFETAGAVATQNLALELVGRGGAITLIGNAHADPAFPAARFELLNRKEVTLTASWMSYSAPFPGVEWSDTAFYSATGALRWSPDLLHEGTGRPLAEAPAAFQLFANGGVNGKLLFVQDET